MAKPGGAPFKFAEGGKGGGEMGVMGEMSEIGEMSEMGEASEIGPQARVGRTSMGLDFKVFKNASC
jgi:hypothetical protein